MIKCIQVGTGNWGQKLYGAFRNKCEYLGYVNLGNSKLGDLNRMSWYDALNSNADFIIVATPIKYLAEYTIEALNAGKHVFLEKPGGSNIEELHQIKKASELNNKQIFIGYKFVYDGFVKYLSKHKDFLNNLEIYIDWLKYGSFKESILTNLLSHQIAMMQYLLGKFKLKTRSSNKNEYTCIINDKYRIHINRMWEYGNTHNMIYCSNNKVHKYDFEEKKQKILNNQINCFINCIENNKKPITDIDFAIDVMKILEEIKS